MDGIINSPKNSPSSKCTRKVSRIVQFLGRKKRIGCMAMTKNDSVDGISSNQESDSETKCILDSRKSESENVPNRCVTDDLNANTNVSLCCAITQNPRTSLHRNSRSQNEITNNVDTTIPVFQQHPDRDSKINEILPTDMLQVADQVDEQDKNFGVSKPENSDTLSQKGKLKKAHRRSISLCKSIFSSTDKSIFSSTDKSIFSSTDKSNEKIMMDRVQSLSATPRDHSPESSPSPVPHSGGRTRFLMSRRSVDNIAISSGASSPLSIRSNPPNEEGKKIKKSRPASLIVLSKRGQDRLTDTTRTASMDSLARQSLLAAQVLNLIPASKARERNFLCGRIAANSLLGKVELERVLPQREVRIYVATWNMNGQAPPQGLNPLLLPEGIAHVPDIVVIGTQESYPEKLQWEITLQETLGPSHVLFHSSTFGTLHMAVFLRRDLIWFCSVADEASYSVRPGTAFRTKGAIAVAFYLFGTTFLFLTCHLTAHQDKVKERLQDIRRIVKALELPNRLSCRHKYKDVTDNFDYVFWSGDLNFRLTRPRSEVLDWVAQQSFPLLQPAQCTPGDQLTECIMDGSILKGFEEGPLTFAPTYKYDTGSQNFDTSNKQRTPSYTDRILYKTKRIGLENAVECLSYSSVPTVSTSDHKPVWGLYKCPIRPGIDTIPLNAGLFNREIYLEAIKRRASALDQADSASAVCSVQ